MKKLARKIDRYLQRRRRMDAPMATFSRGTRRGDKAATPCGAAPVSRGS